MVYVGLSISIHIWDMTSRREDMFIDLAQYSCDIYLNVYILGHKLEGRI